MNGMEQQIQAAAGRLFLHYGYRKTSVDQIAREAGIGKGTIYNYFRNKEELFGSCSRHWRNLVDEYLQKHCDFTLEQPVGFRGLNCVYSSAVNLLDPVLLPNQ